MQSEGQEPAQLRLLRLILFTIMTFTIVGTSVELILLEHYESRIQWIPLISLALALILVIAAALRPGRRLLRLFQGIMLGMVAVGVAGVYFHFKGNIEFALETYPELRGRELLWEAATGATPALAPGSILQLGLIGLAATFRHPGLRRRS